MCVCVCVCMRVCVCLCVGDAHEYVCVCVHASVNGWRKRGAAWVWKFVDPLDTIFGRRWVSPVSVLPPLHLAVRASRRVLCVCIVILLIFFVDLPIYHWIYKWDTQVGACAEQTRRVCRVWAIHCVCLMDNSSCVSADNETVTEQLSRTLKKVISSRTSHACLPCAHPLTLAPSFTLILTYPHSHPSTHARSHSPSLWPSQITFTQPHSHPSSRSLQWQESFRRMSVLGQFNKGFIITRQAKAVGNINKRRSAISRTQPRSHSQSRSRSRTWTCTRTHSSTPLLHSLNSPGVQTR